MKACVLSWFLSYNFLSVVWCFNIDTKFPILFEGTAEDYFGYNVALLRNRAGNHVLIAAPRANSSVLSSIRQPGVLYSCKISLQTRKQSCSEVVLDKKGNTKIYFRNDDVSYHDKKDDMFLGISLDVQQNARNNRVVTCGHLWKNQLYQATYLANGVCYVIDAELDPNSVQKLVPLVSKAKQSLHNPSIYLYAFAQAGTSVAFSEDGKNLLLGAPGFYDWTGTVLSYDIPVSGNDFPSPSIPTPPIEQKLSPESYIGYAITSGRFFENFENYVALGAPRDHNSYGQVFIVKALKRTSGKLSVHMKKAGTQFGEYFGASLAAVNLNNDEFTDLLIGAPFYSTENVGDEGRVYVYVSNGVGLDLHTMLYGEKKAKARFGSCITGIGDINQDGFNDVGIGAPYEDGAGVVYIYHGTSSGINSQYSQRITAAEISPLLSGFGISISHGLDIDGNYLPDVVIGSYASSRAVLLRTHPIISLTSRIYFTPDQINTNVTDCKYDGINVSCINATICLRYMGKNSPFNIDFQTQLQMDYGKLKDIAMPRGYLIVNGKAASTMQRKMNLQIGKEDCITFESYIRPDAKDVITPIDFHFKYNLANESQDRTFCKNCAVVDPNSAMNVQKSISFQTGCGKDNECLSNLVVKATIVGNPKNEVLVIGQNDTLILDISVSNIGEPAYLSELLIYLPQETPNVNQDFCTVLTDQQKQDTNASLQCDLGNPLQKGQTVNIQIKIDISRLPTDIEQVVIRFESKTASTETFPLDNELELPIAFKTVADISITGIADHEQIPFNDTDEKPTLITHSYFVMNYGPSPIQTVDIELLIPTAIQTDKEIIEFLNFVQLESDTGQPLMIPAKCNDSSLELTPDETDKTANDKGWHDVDDFLTLNESTTVKPDRDGVVARAKKSLTEHQSTKMKDLILDCKTARCMLIQCSASPFIDSRKFTKISVSLRLKPSVLNTKLEPWYRIDFITQGRVFIRGQATNIQPEHHQPDTTTIKTILVRSGPPPSQEVAKWIIFVSIGIGVLLLIIILVTLIKIGFFKRQQKDKMEQMMLKADLKEWEPYFVADDAPAKDSEEVLKDT